MRSSICNEAEIYDSEFDDPTKILVLKVLLKSCVPGPDFATTIGLSSDSACRFETSISLKLACSFI